MESSYRLAVERVRANAERIRRVELPGYEELVNVRAKRFRLLADLYDRLTRRRRAAADDDLAAADDEYCAWRRLVDADPGSCHCRRRRRSDGVGPPPPDSAPADDRRRNAAAASSSSSMPAFDGCHLPPVEPLIHHRSLALPSLELRSSPPAV